MKKPIAARSALKQPAAKRPVEQVMKKTSAARLSGKPLKNLVVGARTAKRLKKPDAAAATMRKKPAAASHVADSAAGLPACPVSYRETYRSMVWNAMTPGERADQGVRGPQDIHIIGMQGVKGGVKDGILFKAGEQLYALSNGDTWLNPATFKKLKTVIRLYIHTGTRTRYTQRA